MKTIQRNHMPNKQWKDVPRRQKKRLAIVALVELVLTTVALWDLTHRPAAQVRGKKLVWALASFVQPVGPISYLLFGRKRS
jgi:hypothetical protein